ncbi:hypothetical protein [Pedobacter mucosus]|uniref:hypothetical protein n=1 Tax=Pedobacter mucosus TaxID=2895286 RepID=UPI001EE48D1B|nr:hypothetical protein [Pedobacter mucosus]UKT62981.1 hypothetical protein LOK61_14540 [Pedobacter mucosus]
MEKRYKLLILFFSLIALISLAGFVRSYFSFFPNFSRFNIIIHLHFLAFICWFALIIIQPILIMKKRFKLHRQLGRVSYFLAPILVITIALLIKDKIDRDIVISKSEAAITAFIGLMDIVSFSTCYVIAMVFKNDVRWHIAFIIGASLIVLNPGMARLLNHFNAEYGLIAAVITPFFVSISILVFEKSKFKRPILKSPYLLFLSLWTLEILLLIIVPQTTYWIQLVVNFEKVI